ncbi:MAG: hypothetical protein MHPSP_001134 [Paramarteilia canceri]
MSDLIDLKESNTSQVLEDCTEEFTQYLEDNGVINAITKALLELYELETKPKNVLKFLINSIMDKETSDELKAKDEELENLRTENEELKKENLNLKEISKPEDEEQKNEENE